MNDETIRTTSLCVELCKNDVAAEWLCPRYLMEDRLPMEAQAQSLLLTGPNLKSWL